MRLLVIGGTGLISSEFVAAALARGDDVTLVTRGVTGAAPAHTRSLHADATHPEALRSALRGQRLRGERFGAVVQFIAFDADHVTADVATFAPLADRYVLVATAAAYRKLERFQLLTEDTPQDNPHWAYARDKAAAEAALRESATAAGLPFTIVRPAHTYGRTKIPGYAGVSRHPWTLVDRMRRGADIVIPGDGTSTWTVTHASDVAAAMRGLLDTEAAVGRAVHVTSKEALTWNGIHRHIALAAGLSDADFDRQAVHVPTDALVAADPAASGSLYGDKMHGAVYDTSLLEELLPGWAARVPFAQGVAEAIAHFEDHPELQTIDDAANARMDALAAIYRRALDDARGIATT